MSREILFDYILDIVQEEACLISDTVLTSPGKCLDTNGANSMWIGQIVDKMLGTYKE